MEWSSAARRHGWIRLLTLRSIFSSSLSSAGVSENKTGSEKEPVFCFSAAFLLFSGHFPLFVIQRPLSIMIIPDNLKYDDKGLIPAVIQDWETNEVLMVAYMNAVSLKKTVDSGLTWFWSRSRRKFWQKGETSGHVQRVKDILYDCDQDTLLVKVEQTGPACHTGSRSCFFRSFSDTAGGEKT
jgi:phosphoribosyl-AMP cyclohydrolase